MVKMLESKAVEFVENLELESEVNDKRGPKVVDDTARRISPQPTEIIELPIETLVDNLAEPILKLVPSLTIIRASIFLRSPDVYDPLQIFFFKNQFHMKLVP